MGTKLPWRCVCGQEFVITKTPTEKLGMSIKGGAKNAAAAPTDRSDEGIFISRVSPGAPFTTFLLRGKILGPSGGSLAHSSLHQSHCSFHQSERRRRKNIRCICCTFFVALQCVCVCVCFIPLIEFSLKKVFFFLLVIFCVCAILTHVLILAAIESD